MRIIKMDLQRVTGGLDAQPMYDMTRRLIDRRPLRLKFASDNRFCHPTPLFTNDLSVGEQLFHFRFV
jgi:hypothetical protein